MLRGTSPEEAFIFADGKIDGINIDAEHKLIMAKKSNHSRAIRERIEMAYAYYNK